MTAEPYLTATQVRERISVGGARLDAGTYLDEWVEEQVAVWEHTLEDFTGDAYVERDADWTGTVYGCSTKLITPFVNITAVTSVAVDGTAVTVDDNQPELAGGIIAYAGGFRPGQTIRFVGTYGGNQSDAVLAIVKQTTAMYVEQMAAIDRAASTPDASRVFNDLGGSTVYVTPDPYAYPPRLTGYREIDRKVNTLPRYTIPGLA